MRLHLITYAEAHPPLSLSVSLARTTASAFLTGAKHFDEGPVLLIRNGDDGRVHLHLVRDRVDRPLAQKYSTLPVRVCVCVCVSVLLPFLIMCATVCNPPGCDVRNKIAPNRITRRLHTHAVNQSRVLSCACPSAEGHNRCTI